MSEEQLIYVVFWTSDERDIFSVSLQSFPSYKVGDEIYLSASVTPHGRSHFPRAQGFNRAFIVERIVHSVRREYSNDITDYYQMDVYLREREK